MHPLKREIDTQPGLFSFQMCTGESLFLLKINYKGHSKPGNKFLEITFLILTKVKCAPEDKRQKTCITKNKDWPQKIVTNKKDKTEVFIKTDFSYIIIIKIKEFTFQRDFTQNFKNVFVLKLICSLSFFHLNYLTPSSSQSSPSSLLFLVSPLRARAEIS